MSLRRRYQAIIVGAGQAGLAAAHELLRRGLTPGEDFIMLDGNDGPGGAWRHRWDSLTLGRAHGIADLPGLPLGSPPSDVPAAQIVADYYERYEQKFALPVLRPYHVIRVESPEAQRTGPLRVTVRTGNAGASAGEGAAGGGPVAGGSPAWPSGESETLELQCSVLLNATGTWTHPYVPYVPGIETFTGRQLHTAQFTRAQDFAWQRTLVVGGGLSAVQFLLQLARVTDTLWATRRPPNFLVDQFDNPEWGIDVERGVRARISAGLPSASVVRHTGIPLWPEYVEGVKAGMLVSHGMFDRITDRGVVFGVQPAYRDSQGLGPSQSDRLVLPESWRPFGPGHSEEVDVIFWNTGFRPALNHLAPLHLRAPGGGIRVQDEVTVQVDPRIYLVGYGSTASTIGATRAGRLAGRKAMRYLRDHGSQAGARH